MKMLVASSCPTLFNLMDCSLPGSSVYGILQARMGSLLQQSFLPQGSNLDLLIAGKFRKA